MMNEAYWYEHIANAILAVNTDVLFLVDKMDYLGHTGVKTAVEKKYRTIQTYEREVLLRYEVKNGTKPLFVKFLNETDIPYDLLSRHAVFTLDCDTLFPYLDRDVVASLPLSSYQAVYEYFAHNPARVPFERMSAQQTEEAISRLVPIRNEALFARCTQLEERIRTLVHTKATDIREWCKVSGELALAVGELTYYQDAGEQAVSIAPYRQLIQEAFAQGIIRYYDEAPYNKDLPFHWHLLKKIHQSHTGKTALLCFDCMGVEEWNVVKAYLKERAPDVDYEEDVSFAVVPTDTQYSRLALFSGLTPQTLMETKLVPALHTQYEEKLFKQGLALLGADEEKICYIRANGPPDILKAKRSLDDYQWVGIVFSFIDILTHNKLSTKRKLVRDIEEYLVESGLDTLIVSLLDHGFSLYLGSDHGSVYATGNGTRIPKDLVNASARRYVLFEHERLAKEYASEDTVLLQLRNVLGDAWLLIHTSTAMFGSPSETGLTHGGISLEEVVVPFVKVKYQ